jgi:hypothetical protein
MLLIGKRKQKGTKPPTSLPQPKNNKKKRKKQEKCRTIENEIFWQ